MKQLLLVYHSQSGASARLAQAAARGARMETGVATRVLRAWDASTADLAGADGLLLVAAENSGSLSGGGKDFLDRTFYPAIERGLVMPYTALISAGNDGRGARQQVQRVFSGYPFPCAVEPVIFRGPASDEYLEQAREFGEAFAAGIAMGIF